MSLAQGHPYFAIPGPSVLPDRVQRAMHRASPNIYGGEILELVDGLIPDLKRLAGTSGHLACYIANGHGVWEAANANVFSRGERALVLSTGHFAHGWASATREMGVEVEILEFGASSPVEPSRLEAHLRADLARADGRPVKAVLVTQVDTASGLRNDIASIRAAMDAARHPALLVVDCIASLGCDPFRMDEWGVDVALSASQKGLMCPPGMGFVWFNARAEEVCGQGDLATPYWRWGTRAHASEFWQLWFGTAPTHHLWGLREALDMILHEEGLEQVWRRHAALSGAVHAAIEAWGEGNPAIALNVHAREARAAAVTAACFGKGVATPLREWCEREAGVTLGIGLGMATKDDPQASGALRVAHMGHVNAHMTLGVLATMEAGLEALGVARGAGALAAASQVVVAATRGA